MLGIDETVRRISEATNWDQRVQAIRRIPELHGQQEAQAVYAALAERLYRPNLSPQFAFVNWTPDYELDTFATVYAHACDLTVGFTAVDPQRLAATLTEAPETLLIFRTIIGYTPQEFAAATAEVAKDLGTPPMIGLSSGLLRLATAK